MARKQDHSPRDEHSATAEGFVLGRERFAMISAVEGIGLSTEMAERVRKADRNGDTDQQRRDAIIHAHRRG